MHVHGNQFDPMFQSNLLYAAEKAEAKKEAERTRRKLLNAASALAGEYEDAAVVSLSGDDASEEQARRQNGQSDGGQEDEVKDPGLDGPFSDWA
jgi:hypothetical protein